MRRLFTWARMAFRSAVRAEVDRAMNDRRARFSQVSVELSEPELRNIASTLRPGVPCPLPLAANDHVRPSSPARR